MRRKYDLKKLKRRPGAVRVLPKASIPGSPFSARGHVVVSAEITLIPLRPEFSEELFSLVKANRAQWNQFLFWTQKVKSVGDVKRFIAAAESRRLEKSAIEYGIFESDRLVGCCGFVKIEQDCERSQLAYYLDSNCQGRGIVSRCLKALIEVGFIRLKLHRLELRITPENEKSVAVAERLGFRKDGVLREAVFINGRYQDMAVYSLLASD